MSGKYLDNHVLAEMGRLRGNASRLWDLMKKAPLDRESCKNMLLDIRKSLKIIFRITQDKVVEYIRGLSFNQKLLLTTMLGKDPEEYVSEVFRWPRFESEISSIISKLENPRYFSDKDVKSSISSFVENLEADLRIVESRLDIKYGLFRIFEFLGDFPQFTENWAVATCYLTAMEIAVNKKLEALKLKVEGGFKEKYKALLKKLREESVEFSELITLTTYVEKVLRALEPRKRSAHAVYR